MKLLVKEIDGTLGTALVKNSYKIGEIYGPKSKETAEYIVRAVNSHELLLAALIRVRGELVNLPKDLYAQIDDAIAKSEDQNGLV